ncbi:MAG: ABC transporter permease [Actinobacteria bacterium]|nr:ABC transporter permease [Actinomycetota bacterium]
MKPVLAQLRLELTLTLRNGEQMLVNLLIPLGLLVFLSTVDLFDTDGDRVATVAPAILALAVMSSALVSLGISTGFERYYGVLKRLGATPLGRPRWIAAKFGSVIAIEMFQWVVLSLVALWLGWSPDGGGWPAALGAAVLGTAAFGGLGLLLAGTLSGLTNLALCNGLYLVLMLTGGMVVPLDKMPGAMERVASVLPAAPLTDLLGGSLTAGEAPNAASWAVLGAWAVAAPIVAAWRFRWH